MPSSHPNYFSLLYLSHHLTTGDGCSHNIHCSLRKILKTAFIYLGGDIWRLEDNFQESFLSSTMWGPRLEFRSPGLAASILICWICIFYLIFCLRPGLPTQPRYVLPHSASSHSTLLDFLTLPTHLHCMFLSLCQILEQATAAFGPFLT